MITHAIVTPHPPLLVPELVPGAVESTAAVREASLAAVRRLAAAADTWLAIGVDTEQRTIDPDTRGSFRGFGVDVGVTLTAQERERGTSRCLPLPALIAGWLREQGGARHVQVELLPETIGHTECLGLGEQLAATEDEFGLLVLGDGSSRHPGAPAGWEDQRAEDFDGQVRAALETGDVDTLLSIDAELARELGAQGRAAWQVLAGAAQATPHWTTELLYSAAPFGVAYHVAVWERM